MVDQPTVPVIVVTPETNRYARETQYASSRHRTRNSTQIARQKNCNLDRSLKKEVYTICQLQRRALFDNQAETAIVEKEFTRLKRERTDIQRPVLRRRQNQQIGKNSAREGSADHLETRPTEPGYGSDQKPNVIYHMQHKELQSNRAESFAVEEQQEELGKVFHRQRTYTIPQHSDDSHYGQNISEFRNGLSESRSIENNQETDQVGQQTEQDAPSVDDIKHDQMTDKSNTGSLPNILESPKLRKSWTSMQSFDLLPCLPENDERPSSARSEPLPYVTEEGLHTTGQRQKTDLGKWPQTQLPPTENKHRQKKYSKKTAMSCPVRYTCTLHVDITETPRWKINKSSYETLLYTFRRDSEKLETAVKDGSSKSISCKSSPSFYKFPAVPQPFREKSGL